MTSSDDQRAQPLRRNPLAPAAPLLNFGLSLPPELSAPRDGKIPLAVKIAFSVFVAILILVFWMHTGQAS